MSDSFVAPWTVSHQAPLSMGFPRQEYQSRLPFPSPGDLPNPRIEPMSPALQAGSLPLRHWVSPESSAWQADFFFFPTESLGAGGLIHVCQSVSRPVSSVAQPCPTLLQTHELCSTRLLCPWDFPGKNTGTGCHSLLQGIFPTQGSNLHLLYWQVDSLPLSHLGSLNQQY